MLMRVARTSLLAMALGWALLVAAQIPVPPLTARITDQAAVLTAEQKASLEQKLQTFEARKGSQLAVLIVPTTAPETIEQYALRVVEQWKLGRKKVDDGALMLIATTDRALRIEVGYGLEGALNDATSKRIISEVMTPHFKAGDFYAGITAGVDQIIRVIDGEPLPESGRIAGRGWSELQQYVPIIFMLALVVGGILRSWLGRFPGALVTGGAVAVAAWLFAGALSIALLAGILALLFTLFGGGMGGLGIGGHRGGFGGGGFGGGFGGGGASGRW